ncbi:MAG: MlaD family protein [Bacteroidota bacterium]
MEEKAKNIKLKVFLTLLTGFIIMVVLVVLVGIGSNLFSDNYHIRIFAENIEGLTVNSPVMLGGMKIGSVKQMDFVNAHGKTGIIITMLLQSRYSSLITKDSKATIKTLGLLGDKFIDIDIGTQGEKPLGEGSYIALGSSPGMDNITQKLNTTLENLNGIFADVKKMTGSVNNGNGTLGRLIYRSETLDNIDRLVVSVTGLSRSLQSEKSSFGKLIHEDSLYRRIDQLALNLAEITGHMKQGKGNAGRLIYDDSLYTSINGLLNKVSLLVDKTSSSGNTAGRLMNDDELYRQLMNAIENTNRLISNISADPKKYLKFSVF